MIARALELIRNTATYQKIIISKPAVEAEKPWILPGDMRTIYCIILRYL
jgi:phosphate starvation-inducible protein PhoH